MIALPLRWLFSPRSRGSSPLARERNIVRRATTVLAMNNTSGPQDRREFLKTSLKTTTAVGMGVVAFSALTASAARDDMTAVSQPGNTKPVPTEELFRKGVIGPAELSKATSDIAKDKATNKNAKEFAGFEYTEAIAVTTVLKDLDTPVPPMDSKAQATLAKIKSSSGAEFDRIYITAQLENHEFLRDHAMAYLKNAEGKTSPAESQGRHLATLALATFKEHVAICQRILGELAH